ncbi:hypothetical protein ACLKA7_008896 [Drosophila subpalustris]
MSHRDCRTSRHGSRNPSWIFLSICGIIMALISYGMEEGIRLLFAFHFWLYEDISDNLYVWVMDSVCIVVFKAFFVHHLAPQAAEGQTDMPLSTQPTLRFATTGVVSSPVLSVRLIAVFQGAKTVYFATEFPFDSRELVFFALTGALCGLLSAFFVWIHRHYGLFVRSNKTLNKFLQKK